MQMLQSRRWNSRDYSRDKTTIPIRKENNTSNNESMACTSIFYLLITGNLSPVA